MKKHLLPMTACVAAISLVSAYAQFAPRTGGPQTPHLSGAMAKLFGDNSAFTATLVMSMEMGGQTNTMPGKIAFDHGKSRFEMDLSDSKGGHMPPEVAAHIKAMGMGKIVTISDPEKQTNYMIYPDLQAYAPVPAAPGQAAQPPADYKLEVTEEGKETVDGHPCVRNKAVVTDDQGQRHEFTMWNATDLKNFPVKIATSEQGHATVMLFKDVKLAKPDASLFTAPADYKKYGSMQEMMRQEMMKRMPSMGMPPQGQ